MKIAYISLILTLMGLQGLYAQESRTETYVNFREDIKTIDSEYGDNAERPRSETIIPVAEQWQRHLYVKTNVIGWGMLVTNAAIEVDISNRWSFTLPFYYSAWNYFSSTIKVRTLAVQPEIRYWLSDSENDGWFTGAHFGMAQYNLAFDGEYRTQDRNGKTPALGGGLSIGYRMPIGKDSRWKMEFSLGAGIYDLHYDKFRNDPDGFFIYSERKTYLGIDNVAISLSYMFDLKK